MESSDPPQVDMIEHADAFKQVLDALSNAHYRGKSVPVIGESTTDFVQLAEQVVSVVHDLQFVGRTQADAMRPAKDGPILAVPAKADRMPLRFEAVPILAILAEFYQPGWDYMAHPVTTLRAAIRYAERCRWIEPYHVHGGEAEVLAGFVQEVESTMTGYYRPDGVYVGNFRRIQEVDNIPSIYQAVNTRQFREEMEIGDMPHFYLSGITVGGQLLYWAFRRMIRSPMCPDLDGPTQRLTLGYPAALSGYPPDLNYVITDSGIQIERAQSAGSNAERSPSILSTDEQAMWDALAGTALTANQLMKLLDKNSEDAIRKMKGQVIRKGFAIKRRGRQGYYRPDAPPPNVKT